MKMTKNFRASRCKSYQKCGSNFLFFPLGLAGGGWGVDDVLQDDLYDRKEDFKFCNQQHVQNSNFKAQRVITVVLVVLAAVLTCRKGGMA